MQPLTHLVVDHLTRLVRAFTSASAVAWMRNSNYGSNLGENSSRRAGTMVIGTKSGINAVDRSVPSLDGHGYRRRPPSARPCAAAR